MILAAIPGLHGSLCSFYILRMEDVGKAKAEVAAQRIVQRVDGVTVTPHFGRIEEKPLEFYEQFHIFILGLDSLEARRYMNQIACSFLGELWYRLRRRSHSIRTTQKMAHPSTMLCIKWQLLGRHLQAFAP